MNNSKENSKYKTIGEVAKILNLVDKQRGTLSTHTIRFWEKEFKQVKPKIFTGKRRYYDENTINILKKIKFLLKDRGMTLNGAKNTTPRYRHTIATKTETAPATTTRTFVATAAVAATSTFTPTAPPTTRSNSASSLNSIPSSAGGTGIPI